jgi:perosamine synthetase
VAEFVGAKYAVAVSNGTAALHSAMYAAGVNDGDEVILPPMTFVATANAVLFQGGKPVFADVDSGTLLINPDEAKAKITARTKAIVAVDYAGQPCDYESLRAIADHHNLILIADACHSLGAEYKGQKVGSLADLSVFSFHPVKHITTGEGGMVVTNNPSYAEKMRRFRNHGLTMDHRQRTATGTWLYEMEELGYNYRLTDFQCALGISQLKKLPGWLHRRREIARKYQEAFQKHPGIRPLILHPQVEHAYHLYVVQLDLEYLGTDRKTIFRVLHDQGIGVNVHYIPIHLHPYYQNRFGTKPGLTPTAEKAYEKIVSLPIFPSMNDEEITMVIQALNRFCPRCIIPPVGMESLEKMPKNH